MPDVAGFKSCDMTENREAPSDCVSCHVGRQIMVSDAGGSGS